MRPLDPSGAALPVTVVVATRDRPALLRESLGALSSALRDGDGLIVVDSASRTEEVRSVGESAGALVVRCEQPGACRARNVGWRAASTEIVAFTDDDCLPAPGWTSALSAAFARFPDAGFVTGRVLADEVVRGHAELNLSLAVSEGAKCLALGDDLRSMGHGANMAWRRQALEAIGGFDEGMGPGTPLGAAEDQDAFWRALRRGWTGRYDPCSVVVHRHWRNRRQQLRTVYGYGIGSGALEVKRWCLDAQGAAMPGAPSVHSLWGLHRGAVQSFVQQVGEHVRSRYEMGAVGELCFLAGFLRGSTRARRVGLSGGHFASSG